VTIRSSLNIFMELSFICFTAIISISPIWTAKTDFKFSDWSILQLWSSGCARSWICYIVTEIDERSFVHIELKIGASYTHYLGSAFFSRNVGNHVLPKDTASHREKCRHNMCYLHFALTTAKLATAVTRSVHGLMTVKWVVDVNKQWENWFTNQICRCS